MFDRYSELTSIFQYGISIYQFGTSNPPTNDMVSRLSLKLGKLSLYSDSIPRICSHIMSKSCESNQSTDFEGIMPDFTPPAASLSSKVIETSKL